MVSAIAKSSVSIKIRMYHFNVHPLKISFLFSLHLVFSININVHQSSYVPTTIFINTFRVLDDVVAFGVSMAMISRKRCFRLDSKDRNRRCN